MLLPSGSTAELDHSCQLAMAPAGALFLTLGVKSQTPIPGWECGNSNGYLQAGALGLALQVLARRCKSQTGLQIRALVTRIHPAPSATCPTKIHARDPKQPQASQASPSLPRVICRAEEPASVFLSGRKLRERKRQREKHHLQERLCLGWPLIGARLIQHRLHGRTIAGGGVLSIPWMLCRRVFGAAARLDGSERAPPLQTWLKNIWKSPRRQISKEELDIGMDLGPFSPALIKKR